MPTEWAARTVWLRLAVVVLAVLGSLTLTAQSQPGTTALAIQANSNRVPAGKLENGIVTLHLELRQGDWHPEAETAAP